MNNVNLFNLMWISFAAGFAIGIIAVHWFWTRWLIAKPERVADFLTFLLENAIAQVLGIEAFWVYDVEGVMRYVAVRKIKDALRKLIVRKIEYPDHKIQQVPPPPPDAA